MLTSDIIQLFKNFNSHTDDYLGAMYMSIYHQLPQCYRVYYGSDGELHYQHSSELFFEIRKEMKYKIDCRALLKNLQEHQKDYELEIFCYSYQIAKHFFAPFTLLKCCVIIQWQTTYLI